MGQLLLLPDPRPLDERLGGDFFRDAPRHPGVYLMRDAADKVLYVGKAKNLRQRLNHYRVANPHCMARRHLRMVRDISRIEFQLCANEADALRQKSRLIRTLRPKFNRAGTWPARARFLVWQTTGETLQLSVAETPSATWRRFGPLGGNASHLHQIISRLLWLAVNPHRTVTELPAGWMHGGHMGQTAITCHASLPEITRTIESFFWDEPGQFLPWLEARLAARANPFDRTAIDTDLAELRDFGTKLSDHKRCRRQLWLL